MKQFTSVKEGVITNKQCKTIMRAEVVRMSGLAVVRSCVFISFLLVFYSSFYPWSAKEIQQSWSTWTSRLNFQRSRSTLIVWETISARLQKGQAYSNRINVQTKAKQQSDELK